MLFTLILVALIVSLIVVVIALRIYTNGLVKELAIMERRIDQKISLIANKPSSEQTSSNPRKGGSQNGKQR